MGWGGEGRDGSAFVRSGRCEAGLRRGAGSGSVGQGSRWPRGCGLFFFSSRRRHTRWTGDWSSDVCSSDLPDLDADLRAAFRRETEMFFADVLRERRSVLTLLDADYAYLNDRLAAHYGIEGVRRSEERRVGKEGRVRGAGCRCGKRQGRQDE